MSDDPSAKMSILWKRESCRIPHNGKKYLQTTCLCAITCLLSSLSVKILLSSSALPLLLILKGREEWPKMMVFQWHVLSLEFRPPLRFTCHLVYFPWGTGINISPSPPLPSSSFCICVCVFVTALWSASILRTVHFKMISVFLYVLACFNRLVLLYFSLDASGGYLWRVSI